MPVIEQLMIVIVGTPLVVSVIVMFSGATISERYHTHHDTYSVSIVVSRTLMLVMIFMGVLGAITGWLCHLGVFSADPIVPLGFFASFQMTMLMMLIAISRCQVMAYDDRMFVRHWFGRRHEVVYADIDGMYRSASFFSPNPNFRDLVVRSADGSSVRILGLIDIEQLLMRIDRFDVLDE